jgi:hypothetical protein
LIIVSEGRKEVLGEERKFEIDPNMLMELGLPGEMIEKIKESGIPSVNTHAEGGKGGRAINLTYVDNYSSLLLVYTFLLNYLENSPSQKGNYMLNKALLATLKEAINEQQEYRKAFLDAVNLLNDKKD